MVLINIKNRTTLKFFVIPKVFSEIIIKQDVVPLSVQEVAPDGEYCREDLDLSRLGANSGEVFLTIALKPGFLNPDDVDSCCLSCRIREVRELGIVKRSYAFLSLPDFQIVPRPAWQSRSKDECVWLCGKHVFVIHLHRKGWKEFRLVLREADARHHPSTCTFIGKSLMSTVDAPVSAHAPSCQAVKAFEDMYENERKRHFLGHARYAKDALCWWDRPAWTDFNGRKVMKPEMRGTPSPMWSWCGEWQVKKIPGLTDEDGWMYASGWTRDWVPERSFGKQVRRRLWIREMQTAECEETDTGRPNLQCNLTDSSYFVHSAGAVILAEFMAKEKGTNDVPLTSSSSSSLLEDIDKNLVFVSLKEALWQYSKSLSPEIGAAYHRLLQKLSPRYRRGELLCDFV